MVSIPLLAIRLTYSLVFIITGNLDINAIKGNPNAYLVMTMLPKVAIIGVCTYIIGMNISPLREGGKWLPQRLEDQEI
ncbi:hypothetical protein N7486_009799 [Penicillium sp. IBT 16267x]|nr:hypothetical protein N7486_009799 [Penicillium sp. IBT 16267x]